MSKKKKKKKSKKFYKIKTYGLSENEMFSLCKKIKINNKSKILVLNTYKKK